MTVPKAQSTKIMSHIVTVILACPLDDPIFLALEQSDYKDLEDLTLMRESDLLALNFVDPATGATRFLPLISQNRLRSFLMYLQYRIKCKDCIDNASIFSITRSTFCEYLSCPSFRYDQHVWKESTVKTSRNVTGPPLPLIPPSKLLLPLSQCSFQMIPSPEPVPLLSKRPERPTTLSEPVTPLSQPSVRPIPPTDDKFL